MQNSITSGFVSKSVFLFVAILVFSLEVRCQFFKAPQYNIEAGGIGSFGRQAPFWLVNNQYGKYSNAPVSGFLSAKIHSETDSSKLFSLGYILEAFDIQDSRNSFFIHQANIKLRFGFMSLRLGSGEDTYGNQDAGLTSGSLLWAGNTRPMPKIVLETNGYTDVPFTQGYVQFRGLLSHGWFGNDGFVKNAYLHHKNVYIKAGGRLPLNLSFGLQHFTMWGGESSDAAIGKLPSDFTAYRKVFFAKRDTSDLSGLPEVEGINKLGNHLGSWNYGVDIKLKNYIAGIYYQTIFEDYSGFSKFLMRDGLWGLSVKTKNQSKIVNAFLYEYLHTSYQSGAPPENPDEYTQGNDNYFNNGIYYSGWTFRGKVIGTPFISSPSLLEYETVSFRNNRVIAHHLGIGGKISGTLNYRILFTLSKNMGTYYEPFPETQKVQSALVEISKEVERYQGIDLTLRIGADHGKLYGNNCGVFFAIKKSGATGR